MYGVIDFLAAHLLQKYYLCIFVLLQYLKYAVVAGVVLGTRAISGLVDFRQILKAVHIVVSKQ